MHFVNETKVIQGKTFILAETLPFDASDPHTYWDVQKAALEYRLEGLYARVHRTEYHYEIWTCPGRVNLVRDPGARGIRTPKPKLHVI